MTRPGRDITQRAVFSDRRLTINLVISKKGNLDIRSCDVVSKAFRNRTTFPDFQDLDTVVDTTLAQALRDVLIGLPDGPQVISMPDFLVEIPGLVLSGVHLLVTDANNGIRSAIFRFKEFLGAVNAIFLENIGFDSCPVRHNEQLATQVLADVCLPLLNLCHQMDALLNHAPLAVANHLRDRTHELEFQTELLKRFVTNSASRAHEPKLIEEAGHVALLARH